MNTLVALCAIGAEKILGNEIKHLGYKLESNAPGRVSFYGDDDALYRTNLCLRTSDRVYLQMAKYHAENFDELFEGVYNVNWQDFYRKDVHVIVDKVRTYKSKLNSYVSGIRTCITPTDGYFGKDEDLFIEGKTWGDAWKHGLIEGLIIYPVAWFADILANSMSSIGAGAAALLSILIVTIIVRVLMTLATFKSTMSQQKISALQPELAKIQAKYPNSNTNPYDKQRMAQEQMNLYKKYKINPFSSILVLIIQFPIFIGIWGALSGASVLSTGSVLGVYLSESISSVILTWSFNGAWWAALVLFLLMSGIQIVASKLPQWLQKKELKKVAKMGTNPAADQQQKTMKWMQIIMMVMIIVMGFTLPSGMGVYWLVGGLVSMLQTVITQSIMRKKKVK